MNIPEKLNHGLVELNGRKPSDSVAERHDIVLLFDCSKSNPNGDPDNGNMPRVQPDSLKGLVTDVCLKRKIRNFFSLYKPDGNPLVEKEVVDGYKIFIREGAVLQTQIENNDVKQQAEEVFKNWFLSEIAKLKEEDQKIIKNAISTSDDDKSQQEKPSKEIKKRYQAAWEGKSQKKNKTSDSEDVAESNDQNSEDKNGKKKKQDSVLDAVDGILKNSKEHRDCAWKNALCETYSDVRYFGGVVSTEGPLKGSFYGQIRGPLQFTFAESLDKILSLDATITRCAVASQKEKQQLAESESGDNRTMGRKHGIDYGLYRCHIHFSPAFAAKTGFTYYDLDNFLFALEKVFDGEVDHAAGRHLRLMGLVDFQHKSALGNAPAHKLFEQVLVKGIKEEKDGKEVFKSSGSEFPRGLGDYYGKTPEGKLYFDEKERKIIEGTNSAGDANIKANRLVWEIPDMPKQ